MAATVAGGRAQAEPIAPDVVVFCETTLAKPIGDVARLWRRQTGVPVHVFALPTRLLLEEISHGIRSDIVVAEGTAAESEAESRSLIDPKTHVDLWRNRLMVARQAGPAIGATAAFEAPVAIVDAAIDPAGAVTRQALEASGLWDAVSAQAIGVAGTEDAAFLVEDGRARRAVVYATDLPAHPDLAGAAILDEAAYPPIRYWAAETASVRSPRAADFEAFLGDPSAKALLRADGLEILP
jgi:molybdate transport system substrate-binding protein